MKKQYEYAIGAFKVSTREAARIIQRSLRDPEVLKDVGYTQVPKIIQKLTVERVVR